VALEAAVPRAQPKALSDPTAGIQIVPLGVPDPANPFWAGTLDMVIHDATNGTIGASGVYHILKSITANNLTANQTNTDELAFLIHGMAFSEANILSLSQHAVMFETSDSGALNSTLGFTTATYTPRAIAVTVLKVVINSGASTQTGKDVYFVAYPKRFAGTTQADINAINKWFNEHLPYKMTCTAGSDDNNMLPRSISSSPVQFHTDFNAGFSKDDSNAYVWINNGDEDANYTVFASDNAKGPFVTPVGVIHGFSNVKVPFVDHPNRFFRPELQ
jgi:hypothetical protein